MDEGTIKTQLQEVEAALRRNEEEHDVLSSLVSGYKGWLKLRASGELGSVVVIPPIRKAAAEKPAPTSKRPQKGQHSTAKGDISMRAAVRQAIQEANGKPIHVSRILERTAELGARTDGKEPKGVVDLMAYSLRRTQPIEKVGPRLWRWTGDKT